MRITKRQLIRIIREAKAKSTKKYDDDSALKGGQSELPDPLQKGIIDKTVEEREEDEKKDEAIHSRLRRLIREYSSAPTAAELTTDITDMIMVLDEIVEVTGGGQAETPDMGGLDLEHQAEVADFVGDAIVNLKRALSTLALYR